MMKALIILSSLILISMESTSQRVGNFSVGEPGTKEFEKISFWVKSNKRAEITYTYGTDWKETKLKYLGRGVLNGENCFKVKFPNGYTLYIIPDETNLLIQDLSGKYSKTFEWYYEGPRDGIGTFCEPCTDDKGAMKLVKMYYMK